MKSFNITIGISPFLNSNYLILKLATEYNKQWGKDTIGVLVM